MTDENMEQHDSGREQAAEHFHLPPNSYAPISVSVALCVSMVGFLDQVRNAVGPAMWIVGLVWLAVSVALWLRAARNEYLALPESLNE